MSYSDDTQSDQDWKNKTRAGSQRSKTNKTPNKPKYAQKFLEKWLKIFDPWLTRCREDPNKPFCRACQTRLDSNRCHLQRHERTSKHARNLELLLKKGEGAVMETLSLRRERSKYYQQRNIQPEPQRYQQLPDEMDMDTVEGYPEDDANIDSVQSQQTEFDEVYEDDQPVKEECINNEAHHRHNYKRSFVNQQSMPTKEERLSLLMQIQKDKKDLMDSFRELMGSNMNTTSSPPIREKNHIDLFFESVSSSVKALTPKLIAEAKMRVSQLIGELELRALTELENQQQVAISAQNRQSYVVN